MGIGTDARVTYKRRHAYNTRSNKIRKFRTPGAWRLPALARGARAAAPRHAPGARRRRPCPRPPADPRAPPPHSPTLRAGGKITVQYITKAAKGPTCYVTRKALQGLPRARPVEYKRMKKSQRTVSRAYGGVLSAGATRDRIVRAFIAEEQKEAKKRHGKA